MTIYMPRNTKKQLEADLAKIMELYSLCRESYQALSDEYVQLREENANLREQLESIRELSNGR